MAKENIRKFEQLLISDETLQKKLRETTDAYTGDKQDEKAVFDAIVKPLAEESGLPFTYEEVKELANENKEIPLDEADAVAGGKSYCIIVGGGSETDLDDSCFSSDSVSGAGACSYVGFGFIFWD